MATDQVIDQFRSSTWGWLRGTLLGWLTLLLCLVGVGLIIILVKWLGNISTTYEITPERLIIQRGIFNKSIDEIELYRVKDVRMNFSLLNQMAGIGTIHLTTSDETTRGTGLALRYIPDAKRRRETIRALVDAARKRRGVREMDMFTDPA